MNVWIASRRSEKSSRCALYCWGGTVVGTKAPVLDRCLAPYCSVRIHWAVLSSLPRVPTQPLGG